MKLTLVSAIALFVMVLAVTNAIPISTTPPTVSFNSMKIDSNTAMPEIIRNKRDVMIYDWGCEGDACNRDCKGRDYKSGHCTPYALINVRCWCVPK